MTLDLPAKRARAGRDWWVSGLGRLAASLLLAVALQGCAAVSNPVANGIPVRALPPQLTPEPKEDRETIPLNLLGQRAPDQYRLGPNDVLGIWIETVLGEPNQVPPITPSPQAGFLTRLPPAVGYPIAVRPDGTLRLPVVRPVRVQGLTLDEAEEAIRRAYTVDNHILKAGQDRILVSLARPRLNHVLVVRQDSGGITLGSSGVLGSTKRGTGQALDLPAYENDVLNALTLTGGLPGIDAVDEVIIERGGFDPAVGPNGRATLLPPPEGHTATGTAPVTRIPLRMRRGEPVPFGPDDVLLQSGDVVFIEARETDLWYSGGLLPPAEHILPRDHDVDVVQAVTIAGFSLVTGGVTANNLSGSITATGLGPPPPSRLTVVRRTPGGGQIPIQVDLNKALRDPRERILVQAGDVLILQFSPLEAFENYVMQKVNFTLVWQAIHGPHESGTTNVILP
jgi:protein involved in polysaccharide export with SLBB domain